ncbi:MAG: class I SAM-dependent methyltransferase [Pseudomonadota bacterium]|nr:class I SAM-dependent methyltransferase [Pseudomonadota bacterium]
MADDGTMAAYAANIDRYRRMVGDTGGNPMLPGFIDRLADRSAVLDLGCGVGDSAARIRAAGHDVTCIDASPDMALAAKELFGLDVQQQSFDEFDDVAAFDAIWASFSLLHAPRVAMPDMLARIHRALRPDGIVYIGLKQGVGEERDDFGRFYAYYEEAELTGLIRAAGLSPFATEHDSTAGLSGRIEPCLHITARKA